MKIAFSSGEASGDRHAAALLIALRAELGPARPVEAWGIGGVLMAEAGVDLVADSRDWGAIGVVEILRKVPGMFPAMRAMKQRLAAEPPNALVLIDFGGFNTRLASWVRENSICPIFYYLPPGSWRRNGNPQKLSKFTALADLIVTQFPWSEKLLSDAGGNARFVGHPLLDLVGSKLPAEEFDARFGLDPTRTVITLLPGSRAHEIKHVLPVLFGAAGEIAARVPGAQFLLGLAPNLAPDDIADILRREQDRGSSAKLLALMHEAGGRLRRAASAALPMPQAPSPRLATAEGFAIDPADVESTQKPWSEQVHRTSQHATAPLAIVAGMTYDAIARADLVLTCSGTATLEAAILNRPMLIVYRGGKLMEMEWALRKKALAIRFIGLPNILADRMLCPEFIQEQATPHAIADSAVEMLLQPDRLMKIKAEMQAVVRDQLGEPGGIRRAARLFIDELLDKTNAD